MRNLFLTYRALAFVVGVLLIIGTVASAMKYLLTEGSALQQLGESMSIIWMIHGFIYMVYVVVTFVLTVRAKWSLPFLVVLLLAGLIPVLIFFVEHRVAVRLRAEHAELR